MTDPFEPFPRRWQLASPADYAFQETTQTGKASWVRLEVFRPSILKPTAAQGPHQLQYTFTPPDDETVPSGRFYNSDTGVCYLLTEGSWWIRCPGSAGATIKCVLLDAMSSVALGGLEEASGDQAVNLLKIGGTSQTGLDLTRRFLPVTWNNPANITVGTSAVLALAANASRRGLSLFNRSSSGQRIAVSTNSGMNTLDGIVVLDPGFGFLWNPPDGVTTQALYALASASGAILGVTEGT
jgi:hypothetical protein